MKLLIVDDEMQIRTGLEVGIEWEEFGFKEVFVAKNGVEALDICEQEKPEIIITDIQMPGINGLELSRKVLEVYHNVEIIILSGYSDFDYAREAVRIGAFDYLLKPINIKELTHTVEQALKKLQLKIDDQNHIQISKDVERVKWIKAHIDTNEELHTEKIQKLCNLINLDGHYRMSGGVISIDRIHQKNMNQQRIYVRSCIEHILSQLKGTVLYSDENECFFALSVFSHNEFERKIKRFNCEFLNLNKQFQNQYRNTLSIAISRCGNISEFPRLINEASELLRHRLYMGSQSWIYNEEVENVELPLTSPIEMDVLVSCIREFDMNKTQELIDKAFERLIQRQVTSCDFVNAFCMQLRNALMRILLEKGIDIENNFENNRQFLDEIPRFNLIEEYKEWITDLYYLIYKGLTSLMGERHSRMIVRVVDYLNVHYKEEINLTELAEYVNKSSNYLSYAFKKEMGINYVEYLNNLRIEEAKKVLQSTNKMAYEIAGDVGFSNYKYFSQVFKKVTGQTPAQYRKFN